MSKQSKFLSLVLRHKPDVGNLTLDAEGWASVSSVMAALRSRFGQFSRTDLDSLVRDCDKQRFAFDSTKNRIRASQGHSVGIDLQLEPQSPPEVLYHGTKADNLTSIMNEGLNSGKRNHVHLSATRETAAIVANRRSGTSIILLVNTKMVDHPFYRSENGVWLTESVPAEAIGIEVIGKA